MGATRSIIDAIKEPRIESHMFGLGFTHHLALDNLSHNPHEYGELLIFMTLVGALQ